MMGSVKVALDNLPQDATVEIPYLGKFKNNTTTKVDDVKWQRYMTLQPGADDSVDTVEVTTASQKKASEAYAEVAEAAQSDEPLEKSHSKEELKKMAKEIGVPDADKLNKDELASAIESSVGGTTVPDEEGR